MKKPTPKKKAIRTDVFISKITHHADFCMFWYEVSSKRHIVKGTMRECGEKKQKLIEKYKHSSLTVKS